MNTRSLLSAVLLFSSLGLASAANAGGVTQVVAPEFGRDGVPFVTVVRGSDNGAARVQAFGRDVPDTRALAERTKAAVQGDASPYVERFGRV